LNIPVFSEISNCILVPLFVVSVDTIAQSEGFPVAGVTRELVGKSTASENFADFVGGWS
jgi:hypothetical protein